MTSLDAQVRAGLKALFQRCEAQEAALGEERRAREHLARAHARTEERCEALKTSVDAARREAAEARAEAATNAEQGIDACRRALDEQRSSLSRFPDRDEVEKLVDAARRELVEDAKAREARRSAEAKTSRDALERRVVSRASEDALRVATAVRKRDAENHARLKAALDAQRRWATDALEATAVARHDASARLSARVATAERDAETQREALASVERLVAAAPRQAEELAENAARRAVTACGDDVARAGGVDAPATPRAGTVQDSKFAKVFTACSATPAPRVSNLSAKIR